LRMQSCPRHPHLGSSAQRAKRASRLGYCVLRGLMPGHRNSRVSSCRKKG
jgi:hypothetical protein